MAKISEQLKKIRNIFGVTLETKNIIRYEYMVDNELVYKEMVVKGDFPENKKAALFEAFGKELENVIKVTFYKRKFVLYGKKEVEKDEVVKRAYIGEVITLIAYQEYVSSRNNSIDMLSAVDEYVVGGIVHPKTKIVSPLYSGDITMSVDVIKLTLAANEYILANEEKGLSR